MASVPRTTLTAAGSAAFAPEAAETMDLLKRLKELGNVTEHAGRKVAELDKVVTTLRKNREKLEQNIAADSALLADWQRQEDDTLAKIAVVEEGRRERLASKRRIASALAKSEKDTAAFLSAASKTAIASIHSNAAKNSAYISKQLEATRGYSTAPGTTPGHVVAVAAAVAPRPQTSGFNSSSGGGGGARFGATATSSGAFSGSFSDSRASKGILAATTAVLEGSGGMRSHSTMGSGRGRGRGKT